MLKAGFSTTRKAARRSARWTYAFSTLVILIAPDLLKSDFTSDDPETRFYVRILLFIAGTVFATAILHLVEGFRQRRAASAARG